MSDEYDIKEEDKERHEGGGEEEEVGTINLFVLVAQPTTSRT